MTSTLPLAPADLNKSYALHTTEDGLVYQVSTLVAPYADKSDNRRVARRCMKCKGDGLYKGWTYTAVCYGCNGLGVKGTESLGEVRAQWAKEIAKHNREQSHSAAIEVARMMADAGITLTKDGKVVRA